MILDADHHDIFIKQEDQSMKLLYNWIMKKGGKLIYSNHNRIEQEITNKMKKMFLAYSRAGKTKRIPKERVEQSMNEIRTNYQLKSNDLPILGLALASSTKLLCSNDKYLHQDFTNIIPQSKIYQTHKHQHLLRDDICP